MSSRESAREAFLGEARAILFNLKTAKDLGLTIPAAVLARADEVIQSPPSIWLDTHNT